MVNVHLTSRPCSRCSHTMGHVNTSKCKRKWVMILVNFMGFPMIGKIITSDCNVEIVVFNLKMTFTYSPSSAQPVVGWIPILVSLGWYPRVSRDSTHRLLFSFSLLFKIRLSYKIKLKKLFRCVHKMKSYTTF